MVLNALHRAIFLVEAEEIWQLASKLPPELRCMIGTYIPSAVERRYFTWDSCCARLADLWHPPHMAVQQRFYPDDRYDHIESFAFTIYYNHLYRSDITMLVRRGNTIEYNEQFQQHSHLHVLIENKKRKLPRWVTLYKYRADLPTYRHEVGAEQGYALVNYITDNVDHIMHLSTCICKTQNPRENAACKINRGIRVEPDIDVLLS